MQDGLSTLLKHVGFLLKHVGSLIMLFKLYDPQTSVFKSPRTTKLSYFEESKSIPLPIQC